MIALELLIVCFLLLPLLIFPKPKKPKISNAYDYLLVLGAPTKDDGSLSNVQKKRIHATLYYLHAGCTNHIILSGAAVKNHYSEADTMKEALQKQTSECLMETERKARNTYQNLRYTKQAFGGEQILIISTPAHLRRTYFFAKKFYAFPSLGSADTKDPIKEYINEYFRMWNAIYWEIRLFFQKQKKNTEA